jgi:electron transfer flavoprotein-quinone oxidoreductase
MSLSGFATNGVEGGGFLYTNKDTISIGLVLGLKDLREKEQTPYDILNHFQKTSCRCRYDSRRRSC